MLVGQAVAESASIFALVIAILLLFLDVPVPTLLKAAALLGAGICMGLGAIGSGVGSGYPGGNACFGIARQPAVTSQLTTNMLIGSAVCQTPAIFAMVVSLIRANQLPVISNGLLLGGVFTMLYAVGWIIATDSSYARFGVMAAALLITLALGYIRFVQGGKTGASGLDPETPDAGELADIEVRLRELEARMSEAGRVLGRET